MTEPHGSPRAGRDAGTPAPRRGPPALVWWALLVIPLWLVLVLCARWEPVMRDGWGHVVWLRNHPTGSRGIGTFIQECYLQENPRLGQVMTLLAYLAGPLHPAITPIVELAVLALLTAITLGRWPSLRRGDDALAAALITALLAACVPQIGPMLFYRPFTWNYVFGLGLGLAWLMPYRRELASPRPACATRAPLVFVAGVLAGLCNEHTGVAFAAMGALATLVAWRRGGLRGWMIAGLVGFVAGYAVLLTAPAQQLRYGALAQQAGVVQRIVDRGVVDNLRVLGALALALAPAVPLVAIGLACRRPAASAAPAAGGERSHAVLAVAGVVCTLTLLASPKLGPRLYFASIALIAAGLTGWLLGRLAGPPVRRGWTIVTAALAAGALGFVLIRLVAIHRVVGPLGAERLDRVVHSHPGTAITVPRLPYGPSRYFLGDDLAVPAARELLAREYGLPAIEREPAAPEPAAPETAPPGEPGR
ncbi:MAG TPA: DUF6056 family protein [Kofleriaceae bacterium]